MQMILQTVLSAWLVLMCVIKMGEALVIAVSSCYLSWNKLALTWHSLFVKFRQPGTIRTNLNSLNWSYGIVLCDRPKTVNVTSNDCHGMTISVSNWSSSYKKKLNVWKFEKQADDLTQPLAADELHKFGESNVVEDCKFNLKSLYRL